MEVMQIAWNRVRISPPAILLPKFTSRCFALDMLFLEGRSALFKAALCLLGCHKEMLLQQEGFENIMSYFKNSLPDMSNKMADAVINEVGQSNMFNVNCH